MPGSVLENGRRFLVIGDYEPIILIKRIVTHFEVAE